MNFFTTAKIANRNKSAEAAAIGAIFSLSLILSACGSAEKSSVTTTEKGPDGTLTTTTSTEFQPSADMKANSGREVDANAPIDSNNQTVLMGTDTAPGAGTAEANIDENNPENDKVHVNLPGVKVNVDNGQDKVDINLPFVHVHKDGMGNTRIKAPFVRINSRDDE